MLPVDGLVMLPALLRPIVIIALIGTPPPNLFPPFFALACSLFPNRQKPTMQREARLAHHQKPPPNFFPSSIVHVHKTKKDKEKNVAHGGVRCVAAGDDASCPPFQHLVDGRAGIQRLQHRLGGDRLDGLRHLKSGLVSGLGPAEKGVQLGMLVLVVGADVPPELVQPVEILATDLTLVQALDVVRPTMLRQIGRLAESLEADFALEWLEARVSALVHGWPRRVSLDNAQMEISNK
ncbi:hypothetical protein L249_3473 [Ophiocordyceps polyrhachis-furcata BCC 54312]|uniref:Uncharacterized protein n=1 Tax=Ophiocordyceps polyrhachis-furcata BCC 54312 TaxID=1330021 RepID=A0A367LMT4_9HYPO|nr:hypothetical protein L249_3473 [Ophiocordyceps polyrhachis-furcata BCC 54312]